jgi:hypothetical protein
MSAELLENAVLVPMPARLSLAERAARTDERNRDCRDCKMFAPAPAGLSYGDCSAHKMRVKLYHPAGEFFSQCQFKVLTRVTKQA